MTECQIIGTIMWELRKWAQMSQTKTLMTSLSYYVTTRLPLCGGIVTGTYFCVFISPCMRHLLVMFGLSFKDESSAKNSAFSQLQTPRTSRNFYRCKPLKCMLDYVFGRSCVRFLSGPQILSSSVSCRSHHFTHFICELELKIYHLYLLSVDCIKRVERAVSYHIKL